VSTLPFSNTVEIIFCQTEKKTYLYIVKEKMIHPILSSLPPLYLFSTFSLHQHYKKSRHEADINHRKSIDIYSRHHGGNRKPQPLASPSATILSRYYHFQHPSKKNILPFQKKKRIFAARIEL